MIGVNSLYDALVGLECRKLPGKGIVSKRKVEMDNISVIALVIIIFWLVGFGVYLVVSNRQRNLEGDLNHLADMFENDGLD